MLGSCQACRLQLQQTRGEARVIHAPDRKQRNATRVSHTPCPASVLHSTAYSVFQTDMSSQHTH